jgi:lysophospholipase L1-like esterase
VRRIARGLLAAAALAALAAGCRGSDSSASPDSPTLFDIGSNDPSVVVAFGDSISAGVDSYDGTGYRDDLERRFANDGRPGVRVLDEGIGGSESSAGVERIVEVLRRDRPAALVLLYGTNDELRNLPQAIYLREVVATTSENLRRIIDACRANRTLVVLSTIPPVCGPARARQRANIASMNEKIRQIGRELSALDLGVMLADPWNAFLAKAPPDGCALISPERGNHPNDAGYALLADVYYEQLRNVAW